MQEQNMYLASSKYNNLSIFSKVTNYNILLA